MRGILLTYPFLAAAALAACNKSSPPETGAAPAPSAERAESTATAVPGVASADSAAAQAATAVPTGNLTDMLSTQLGLTSDQAKAGVGSILAYAEGKLPAADYQKVASSLPSAAADVQAAKDAGAITGPVSDEAGLNAAFTKLGISPEVASKFVPTVTGYLSKVGGPEVGKLMQGLFPA